MALYLDVPFSEKDEAKALGARWNPALKKWYISDRRKYSQFAKWINGDTILCDHIYIVEGNRTCFRCNKETIVIGFGFDTYFYMGDPDPKMETDTVHIGQIDSNLPKRLEAQLKERYGFIRRYSKELQCSYYANHCRNCHVIQGNYFIFDEVDSPFFIDGKEAAERLVLRKISLPNDVAVSTEISYGTEDSWINKFAHIADSDLKWE